MPKVEKQTLKPKGPAKPGGVLARIRPISEDRDPSIKIMLYGRSGTGKTTTWATFPKPILAMVCSGGNQLGELKSIDTPENADTIFRVTVNDSSEIRTVLEHVRANPGEYATLVLDHASGLQDLILREITGMEHTPEQKSWGMASQQDYGQCIAQSKELLRMLLTTPGNVVVIAQERAFHSDGEGDGSSDVLKPFVAAGLSPSLSAWLNTAVDYICQCYIRQKEVSKTTTVAGKAVVKKEKGEGVEFCLRCAPHETYMTKFRLPKKNALPASIVDPDYEKIANTIIGE